MLGPEELKREERKKRQKREERKEGRKEGREIKSRSDNRKGLHKKKSEGQQTDMGNTQHLLIFFKYKV